ncbi:Spy/CpxP family protein refolding chaperone [Massilia violaceinigra]|uniref:Spy/CpxP family protein refolding chaperone n=1 Tax=Massilia violaceinigra TaxID=2045208 RepID=A0ABY4AD61_9BURK|nr:Spy/CpxP family protein refolding chaperone [Massilia violaceinigra]UOD32115.1 Spy/CpxP family protein refolding chaperone [Massilia violaceinigra]
MHPKQHGHHHHHHHDHDHQGDHGHGHGHGPQRRGRRWLVGAALGLAAGALSLAGASFASEGRGMHGHRAHLATMDPATAGKHIDKMVAHLLSDGTDEQKARVSAIAKAAFADLQPLHRDFKAGHEQAHDLLTAPAIDRAALEQLRVREVERIDQISKRILAAVEDAAEVLTPDQRVRFAAHMKKRMQ